MFEPSILLERPETRFEIRTSKTFQISETYQWTPNSKI